MTSTLRNAPRPLAPTAAVLAALALAGAATGAGPASAAAQSPAGSEAQAGGEETARARGAPGPGPAEGAEDEPGRIDGFWGVAWGADSAAVADRLGPPITVGRPEAGLRYFVYTPLYLERDGFLQMWLDDDGGLVGASWEPMTSDCTSMLRRLVRAIRREHPEVRSRTEGRMTPEMLGGDLCVAALEKGASVTVVWEDTAGTEIRIGTTPGSHNLRMRVLTEALRTRRPQGI